MQMKGPQLRADRFFFPCPRHFCCCLTGFPGDLDQHFHIRGSKLWLPVQPPQGSRGKQVRLPWVLCKAQPRFLLSEGEEMGAGCLQRLSPTEQQAHLHQADIRALPGEELAPGHQPGQPHLLLVVLRY